MDHARRKFFDASKTSKGKGVGTKGVKLMKKLYKVEDKIQDFSLEEKHRVRQEKSRPIMDELKTWIDDVRGKITPSSVAGKAINYAFNEWKYLSVYGLS